MFRLVFCFLIVAVAVVSAGFVSFVPAHVGFGAYGHHSPVAVSYTARVDAPRHDVLALAAVPYGHFYHHR